MDTKVSTFRSFISRTPPLPTVSPRLNSADILDVSMRERSRSQSSGSTGHSRRSSSSSIYSYEGDQMPQSEASWRSTDLEDQQNIFLRPLAYDPSTSNFAQRQSIPMLLEPRTYSPFKTPSLASSLPPSQPDIEPRPSILLPPPPPQVQVPRKHLRTVSLEKAGEKLYKHEYHLLPEELRAQLLDKSSSNEQPSLIGRGASVLNYAPRPQEPEQLFSRSPRDYVSPTLRAFHVGSSPAREMTPVAQPRERSNSILMPAFDSYIAKNIKHGPHSWNTGWASSSGMHGAGERFCASRNEVEGSSSDENVSTHMKLVPVPLFHGRSTPVTFTSTRVSAHVEASKAPCNRWDDSISSTFRPGNFQISFPAGPTSSSRRSTSGSIPISPPFPHPPSPCQFTTPDYSSPSQNSWKGWTADPHPDEPDADVFVAAVGNRNKADGFSTQQAYHMLPEEIIAEYLKTPEGSARSSLERAPSVRSDYSYSSGSNYSIAARNTENERGGQIGELKNSPQTARPPRLDAKAAKDESNCPSSNIASPDSPHLYPRRGAMRNKSPISLHLGWSEKAKQSFDKARSTVRPRHPKYEIEHITYDEKRHIDDPPASAPAPAVEAPQRHARHSRRSSVFSGLVGVWRQTKTEKRRNEIRKMIRHVPNEGVDNRSGRRGDNIAIF